MEIGPKPYRHERRQPASEMAPVKSTSPIMPAKSQVRRFESKASDAANLRLKNQEGLSKEDLAVRTEFPMNKTLLTVLIMVTVAVAWHLGFADKPSDYVYTSGWVVKIDAAANTFTLRNGRKLFQFSAIPSRTSVTINGRGGLQTSVGAAHGGDAALCKVSVVDNSLFLNSVEFTHRPVTARPITLNPGTVLVPYSNAVLDVSNCAHGEMVLDPGSGKIFLVP